MKHRVYNSWRWVILATGFITLFIAYSIRIGAYSILLPEMIKDLKLTRAEAGMIKSAFGVSYLLFSPLMGWLTDLFGGRKVISLSCIFLGGGSFFMGSVDNFISSAIFFSIVGLGSSATWVPITTLVQRWFGEDNKGLALGILSPSYGIGFGSMGLLLPIIVSKYSWRTGWQLLGIFGLILILLNGLLLRDPPKVLDIKKTKGYIEIIKENRFWIIGTSYFLISFGVYTIVDFIVTYGNLELKIPYRVSSLLITIIAFSGVLGGFILTTLSDYIGRRNSLMLIQFSIVVGILFILFVGNKIPYLIIGTLIFGFLYGAIWPMYAACVGDYFPQSVVGTILGGLTVFYGIGLMCSPALTGFLADLTGTFKWAFGLSGLFAFLSGLIISILGKPKQEE